MAKDRWDKFDVVIKGIATIIIPVVIGYYTWSQNRIAEENRGRQDAIVEENRRGQFVTELMTRRESSDTDLRTKMFENLMTNFFHKDLGASSAAEHERRLVVLGLVGLNFQEFNFKPLFEQLYPGLEPEQKQKLRALAREISSRQESLLTHGSEAESNYGISEKIILSEGMQKELKRINASLPNLRKQMSIKLWKIADDHAVISLFAENESVDGGEDGFVVTYFDMPFVDNIKYGNYRYAVTLEEAIEATPQSQHDGGQVIAKVIAFPWYFLSFKDKLLMDDLLKKMGELQKIVQD